MISRFLKTHIIYTNTNDNTNKTERTVQQMKNQQTSRLYFTYTILQLILSLLMERLSGKSVSEKPYCETMYTEWKTNQSTH